MRGAPAATLSTKDEQIREAPESAIARGQTDERRRKVVSVSSAAGVGPPPPV